MVPKMLNFETIFGSPQRCKGGCNGVDVQGSLCKELCSNDETDVAISLVKSEFGAFPVQNGQTNPLFCEIFHQRQFECFLKPQRKKPY